MVDLKRSAMPLCTAKNPKWEDFHITKSMRRERRSGEKVRCGIYRAKPGSPRPEYKQHRIVKLPEGFFNGQIQTGVHRNG